jgi:AraC-like DNA-binding protein
MRQKNLIRGEDIGLDFVEHFGYNLFQESEPLPWHRHDGFEFVYMLEGSAIYENEDGSIHRLDGEQFSILPMGISHHGMDNRNAPCLMSWLVFGASDPRESPVSLFTGKEYEQLVARCSVHGANCRNMSPELKHVLKTLRHNVALWKHKEKDDLLSARLRGIVLELLLTSLECLENPSARTTNEYIRAAMAFLEEHQAENISMVDVADHLGFSASRFYQMFKEQTGRTPNDHLARLRLESATDLLRHTDFSLEEVARETGFSSPQYFCRVFRKYTGRRPSEVRQSKS